MGLLRETLPSDSKMLFDWANDPETRQMSINSAPILWENHIAWFERKISDTHTRMFILAEENKNIGQIRFDWKDGEWLIGYSVAKEFRGMGFGRKILSAGIEKIEKGIITGYVKPENKASVKLFRDLGFTEECTTEESSVKLIKFTIVKS